MRSIFLLSLLINPLCLQARTVKVAAEGSLVPFNYYENKVLTGFEIDLANHLFGKLGHKIEWSTQSFQSLLIGLSGKRYEAVVASLAITPERRESVRFVDPHYCSGPVLVTAAGGPLTADALKGKTAAAKEGTIYFKFLSGLKVLKEAKSLPNNADLIQALLAKRVDAILINEFAAAELVKKYPERRFVAGQPVMKEELAIAVAKDNAALQVELNRELAQALSDGTYAKLSQKYFGRDIRCLSQGN